MVITIHRRLAFLVTGLSLCTNAFHIPRQQSPSFPPLKLSDYEEESSSSFGGKKKNKRIRPRRLSSTEEDVAVRRQEAQERRQEALKDPSLLTSIKFSDRTDLHPATKRALIEVMGLQDMTEIQAKTYAQAVQGTSVVGRARTGTGKTLAFLLPSLERLLSGDKDLYIPGRSIGMLIVAPTRELAQQIADQATSLLTYHSKDLSVACLYGGTKIQRDLNLLSSKLPTILVATPGRLLEHCTETKLQRGRKFSEVMGATKIVVLDEMDCLLDMGFQKDIRSILSSLPRKRQTLLFSATLPRSTRRLIEDILGKDYEEVNCVDEKDVSSLTNARVEQSYVLLETMDQYVSSLVQIVETEANSTSDYKIVIFLPTTKLVAFFAEYLESAMKMSGIYRLHSRMSQSARQRTSQSFRSAERQSVLVTTDVSSRGVDYPDVTLVVQYGSPDNDDTYIHRLGRTGRAGKQGKGLQVVLPFEQRVISKLHSRGIEKATLESTVDSKRLEKAFRTVRSGDAVLTPAIQGAYRSFLACYTERAADLGVTANDVVNAADTFSLSVGLVRPPGLEEKTAIRLGIADLVALVDKE